MDKQTPINLLGELEQFETHATNFAAITAAYYKELVKNNVPAELAAKLAIDVHGIWWSMITGHSKNDTP